MLSQPATYVKAIVAALVAGLSALAAALGGEPSVTAAEWVTIALATVIALGAVYGIPNRTQTVTAADRSDLEEQIAPGNVRKVGGYPGGKVTGGHRWTPPADRND